MKPYALICCAALLGQGCFTLHTVTKNGKPLTKEDTDLHDCYGEVAAGADFEHHWEELHDDIARAWVSCLKARGIRMHGGDHPITIGPGATHEDMQRDHNACLVPAPCKMMSAKSTPGVHSTDTFRPSPGDPGYRPGDDVGCTRLDEDCFGRKGYITASLEMLAELSPDKP